MKRLLLTFCLIAFCSVSMVNAQSRVKSKDLRGVWKLVIPFDEEGDTPGERVILNAVEGLIDEIDIYFEFKKDNRVKVTTNAFGDEDVEYSEWHINKDGSLSIGGTDDFESGDSVWMFDGRRLASYEYNRRGKLVKDGDVHMRRVKR